MDEFDNYIVKQEHINNYVKDQLKNNDMMIDRLSDLLFRIANDVKGLGKHAFMVHTQLDQVAKSRNDLIAEINNNNMNDHVIRVMIRVGRMTEEPIYPEVHPKRIEHDSEKINDLGANFSVMPFSLYKGLELDKLTPTEISLQMTDKSTTLAKDVPVVVANDTILTEFVILDMPEDDNMSIILGRPFLNIARAVIDYNKKQGTFHVNGKEHTMHFAKKQTLVNNINVIEPIPTVIIGGFKIPLPTAKKNKYCNLRVGEMQIPIR